MTKSELREMIRECLREELSTLDSMEEGIFGKKNKKELWTISIQEGDKWTPMHSFDNKQDAIKFRDDYQKKNPEANYLLHSGERFR
jgi:hypothetical protein